MMKKTFLVIFFVALSPFLFSFIVKKESKQKVLKTVIVDAGHGIMSNGGYNGAKGSYSYEDVIALAVAKELVRQLHEALPDVKIIETRPTEYITPLHRRAEIANENHGDLFISIHCNAMPPIRHSERIGTKTVTSYAGKGKKKRRVTRKVPQYRYWTTPNPASGTETYIWALNKSDAKVNSVSKNDEYGEVDSTSNITLPDPSDPVERSRMLVYAQNYFRKSMTFADLVEKGFQSQGRVYRGGVKQRNDKGIWVLQATGMPSVLVEIGFITSKDEENYINSDKGQDEIVANIINALKDYKQKLESRQITTDDKKAF